ncbi:hypothetical protein GCM10020367_37240 [Streptomyces sannanensis]|uniref:Uncharacterized protein n=1 Tax=Streptomyces sannanensis TaxID=285536 RepID=A0ABP6SEJ6_9ACTN
MSAEAPSDGCGRLSGIALPEGGRVYKITQRGSSLGALRPGFEEERNSRTGVASSGLRDE